MHTMQSLVIYILCHNRPEDACHAIRSTLAQTDHNYTLIVSSWRLKWKFFQQNWGSRLRYIPFSFI